LFITTSIIPKLEQILGTSKIAGEERLFHCPFCHHAKPKLSVNFGKRAGMWKCWVCNRRGRKLYYLLRALGISYAEIRSILEDFEEIQVLDLSKEDSPPLHLPPEYIPMWQGNDISYEFRHAVAFLKRRGITRDDIYRYRIGYCEKGEYFGRIIIHNVKL